jgi:probable addiction module antidote protein
VKTRTIAFDAAQHVNSPESQAELLTDAFETGNAGYIANALGMIARARGMAEVARGAGVTREALPVRCPGRSGEGGWAKCRVQREPAR